MKFCTDMHGPQSPIDFGDLDFTSRATMRLAIQGKYFNKCLQWKNEDVHGSDG